MTHPSPAIRQALELLRVEPDQVFEVRAPNVPRQYGKPITIAGWYDDLDRLASAAAQLERDGAPAVYVTLNVINPVLLARAFNRLAEHPSATSSDADVVRRVWLPFDFDPMRPAGISSSPDELTLAKATALATVKWLEHTLGSKPDIWAFSGNGYHLLYRIDLPNDPDATAHVQAAINAAADRFDNERVKVDRTVFNAARIWKLYGTMARKGDQVPRLGRIHRRAEILQENFDGQQGSVYETAPAATSVNHAPTQIPPYTGGRNR